jgi:NADH-quinone oxidoreductase subunit D
MRKVWPEYNQLLSDNQIFVKRTANVGVVTAEQALAWGLTGPCLRGSGVRTDMRRDRPYSLYDRFEFDVPVGHKGDNMDRFLVRMGEVRQSLSISEQALEQMPTDGPVSIDDPKLVLPDKHAVYTTIEATIAHFKIVMEGIKPPPGEAYGFTEAANGELGFFVVSDGSGTPYRVRVRPPCWFNLAAAKKMIEGNMISDIIPTFGSVNMIGGECDR